MSRLGKKQICIPENIKICFNDKIITVEGPNGKLNMKVCDNINIKFDENNIFIETIEKSKKLNMLQGLFRGLVINMINGAIKDFKKELEIIGLGYKAVLETDLKKIILTVGFSHTVSIDIPHNLKVISTIRSDKSTLLSITGSDKCEVGMFAAKIRAVKPVEPYKGFGIRYLGENVIKKAGKAAISVKK
jgi:large subunit ribosomal protein L6